VDAGETGVDYRPLIIQKNGSVVVIGNGLNTSSITGENPHVFQVYGTGLNPTASFGNYGNSSAGNSGMHLWAARGTVSSPTALMLGDSLFSNGYRGWGATKLNASSGAFAFRAAGNFSDTEQPTFAVIETNNTGNDINSNPRSYAFMFQTNGGFTAGISPSSIPTNGIYSSNAKFNLVGGDLLLPDGTLGLGVTIC